MTTGTNPFTSASISGYNSSPPDDDGSQTSANRVSWSKHKTKLADPIKTLAESDISNTSAAFAKTINTDDGVKNLLDGSLAFGADELTISSGSITVDRSAHTVDTESDAASDDLSNIVGTSVYTGALLHLYAADASRQVVVKNEATGAGEIHTKDKADTILSTEYPLVLRYNGTDWSEVSHPAASSPPEELIDNGAMLVSQLGTITGQGTVTAEYTAIDRFLMYAAGGQQARTTSSKDTSVAMGGGFSSSLKIDCTTAEAAVGAGELLSVQYRAKADDLQHLRYGASDARTVVVRFIVRSPKSGTHCVALHQADATRSYIREFNVVSADTPQEIIVTFPGDTSGTINNDVGNGLSLTWPLLAGTDWQAAADGWAAGEDYATSNQQNLMDNTANNFYITGVSMREGSIPVAFTHKKYADVLRDCEQYYEKTFEMATAPAQNSGSVLGALGAVNTNAATGDVGTTWQFRVRKVAAPTIVTYNPQAADANWRNDANSASLTVAVAQIGESGCRIASSGSTAAAVTGYRIHATADARL